MNAIRHIAEKHFAREAIDYVAELLAEKTECDLIKRGSRYAFIGARADEAATALATLTNRPPNVEEVAATSGRI